MKKYDAAYFIEKFTAIPARFWTTKNYRDGNRYCALGHCGERSNAGAKVEANALAELFTSKNLMVTYVNDGHSHLFKQKTPRGRVLAALRSIL